MHEIDAKAAKIALHQCTDGHMITVRINRIIQIMGADSAQRYAVQMMLHREIISHCPYEAKLGQLRKVNAFSFVIGMLRAYINAGLLHIQRLKYQLFMAENMPKGGQLTLCYVNNTKLRLSGSHPVADLLYTALLMLNNVLPAPDPVKVHQQVGNHIAGIGRQCEFFAVVMRRHGADNGNMLQYSFGVAAHRFPVGGNVQSPACPLHQLTSQLLLQ